MTTRREETLHLNLISKEGCSSTSYELSSFQDLEKIQQTAQFQFFMKLSSEKEPLEAPVSFSFN